MGCSKAGDLRALGVVLDRIPRLTTQATEVLAVCTVLSHPSIPIGVTHPFPSRADRRSQDPWGDLRCQGAEGMDRPFHADAGEHADFPTL